MDKNQVLNLLEQKHFSKAKDICEELTVISKNDADVWCLLARINYQMGQYDEAVKNSMKALNLNSKLDDAHFFCARSLIGVGQYEKALKYLKKLIKHRVDYPGAQTLAGKILHEFNQLDSAQIYLDAAIQQDERDVEALVAMADIQERTRKIESCNDTLDLLEQVDSHHPGLLITRARLNKRTGNLKEARRLLEQLLQLSVSDRYLAQAATELGHVLDRMGLYESAYKSFEQANDLMEKMRDQSYGVQYYYDRITRLKTTFTPQFVEKWPHKNRSEKTKPPFFLVSFPRSGTTLTEKILSTHSQIIPSDEVTIITGMIKQLVGQGFKYPYQLSELTRPQLAELRRRYWSMADTATGGKLKDKYFLDKLPMNIIDVGFIYKLFPDARLIFVLRDPRDVCLSCFMQLFSLNPATIHFTKIENAARFYAATMDLWFHYRKILKIKYHTLHYESMVDDMEGEMRKLLKFLGLPWEKNILQFYTEQGMGSAITPSYQDVNKPIYSRAIGRWTNYEQYMQSAINILQPFINKFGYETL